MSMIRNGDEVLVLRHATRDEARIVNKAETFSYDIQNKLVAIGFENKGDTTVTINKEIVLAVGDALQSFKGEIGVYKKRQWELAFGAGANPMCVVYEVFETDSFLESIKIPLTVGVK